MGTGGARGCRHGPGPGPSQSRPPCTNHCVSVALLTSTTTGCTHPDGRPLVEGEEPTPMKLLKDDIVEQSGAGVLADLPSRRSSTSSRTAGGSGTGRGDVRLRLWGCFHPSNARPAIDAPGHRDRNQREDDGVGDMLLNGRLAKYAQSAVSGKHCQTIVWAELAALTKAMARRVIPPAAVIKEEAARRVAGARARPPTGAVPHGRPRSDSPPGHANSPRSRGKWTMGWTAASRGKRW